MISDITVNKEVCTFNISDDSIALTNSIRRILMGKFNTTWVMKLEKITHGIEAVKYEEFERLFRFIYLNHVKLKKLKNLEKIKFSIDISSGDTDTDYSVINSDSIVFSVDIAKGNTIPERNDDAKIPSPIRQNLYICTLLRGEKLVLSGRLAKIPTKVIGYAGHDYTKLSKIRVTITMLEIYTIADVLQYVVLELIKKFIELKDMFKTGKLEQKKEKHGYIYRFRENYGHTELNLLCEYINTLDIPCKELMVSYHRIHNYLDHYDLKVYSLEQNKIMILHLDGLIKKIDNLYKQIKKQTTKRADLNRVIDDY